MISVTTDKELFSRIAEGDETAFEQVFRQYVPKVSRIVYGIVKAETATQDLVQEVFLYLWLGREKLIEVNEPVSWLCRIALNQSYQYLRKQQIYQKTTASINMEQQLMGFVNDTELQTNLNETFRLIRQAISQLPDQSRRVYELNRLDGQRPADIAEALGISVQSVRNSLTRSGKLIRDYLAKNGVVVPLLILILPLPDFF